MRRIILWVAAVALAGCAHRQMSYNEPQPVGMTTHNFGRAYDAVASGQVNSAQSGEYLIERDRQGKIEVLNTTKSMGAGEAIKDSWITTRLTSEYAVDPNVKATRVHVNTDNGVVTLSGRVESPDQAQYAINRALQVKGVRAVKSDLVYPMMERGTQTYVPPMPER